ncbi:MAG TPA: methyltransferase domain-containing protein [bacterium]|nr:methyltransferase domain-containing protein [bacterium]
MVVYDWNEEFCRQYADGLRPFSRFDHGMTASMIAGELEPLPEAPAILDIATGPAFLLIQLAKRIPNAALVGQDSAAPMLAIAREEAARAGFSIDTMFCSADNLSAADASFDIVVCKQLLHEADNPAGVISEALRALKPEGKFFLVDFDADSPKAIAVAMRVFLRVAAGRMISGNFWKSYSSGLPGVEVRKMVSEAGFENVKLKRAGMNYFISARKRSKG